MKKLLAILAAATLIFSTFAGCGEDKKGDESTMGRNDTTEVDVTNITKEKKIDPDALFDLTATEVYKTKNSFSVKNGGIVYKDSAGKYGIVSLDGKNDTGAKYTYCDGAEMYFEVSSVSSVADESDAASYNVCGLVDGNGKELVPQKYAYIKVLNERYATAYTAKAFTTDKNNYLFRITEALSLAAQDVDTLFTGEWCIYDLEKAAPVSGAMGTKATIINAYGNNFEYRADNGKYVKVSGNGHVIPEEADFVRDGNYYIEENGKNVMYDENGNKMFEFDSDLFIINYSGDYYKAEKSENGNSVCMLMDKTGNVVSSEFGNIGEVYGKYIYSYDEKCLYSFDGRKLAEGTEYISSCLYNEGYVAIELENGKGFIFLDDKENKIFETADTDVSVMRYDFSATKKDADGNEKTYCFKDGDFTINGRYIGTGVASVKTDKGYDVVNTFTGETIMSTSESLVGGSSFDGVQYIYVNNEDGSESIYAIKAN